MEISSEMLAAAVKKAVELGVIPKWADEETYMSNWNNIKSIVAASIEHASQPGVQADALKPCDKCQFWVALEVGNFCPTCGRDLRAA